MQQTELASKNEEIFSKLKKLIPGGVNSPIRSCQAVKHHPVLAAKAQGDCVWDPDGKKYIDYCMSWGPLIHGHCHPEILASATQRMLLGTTFGMTTEIEGELAQAIIEALPSIDRIRFVSSGTEATMTALRVARGYTKRDIILKFSGMYHGHADFLLKQAGSGVSALNAAATSAGIPTPILDHTACLPFNDCEAFVEFIRHPSIKERLAAVILEPIAGNMGVIPATKQFMHLLREETHRCGALLIFDEVITGFRVGLHGAQGHYGVKPDLTCLGKIIGGGFPAAAFGGCKEIMECLAPLGPVYQAGTLSGNPVAMEAGLTTLRLLKQPGFYEELKRKADIITVPVRELIEEKNLNVYLGQYASLFSLFFGVKTVRSMEEAKASDAEMFTEFFRFMLERGVYIPPYQLEAWFVSMAHTDSHLMETRDHILSFLDRICT